MFCGRQATVNFISQGFDVRRQRAVFLRMPRSSELNVANGSAISIWRPTPHCEPNSVLMLSLKLMQHASSLALIASFLRQVERARTP